MILGNSDMSLYWVKTYSDILGGDWSEAISNLSTVTNKTQYFYEWPSWNNLILAAIFQITGKGNL